MPILDIHISSASLKSGEEFTLSYAQTFKSEADVKRLVVQLILRELAWWGAPKDRQYITHDKLVQISEFTDRHFRAGETIRQDFRRRIRRGAMHSFDGNNNHLRGLIKVIVMISIPLAPDINAGQAFILAPRPQFVRTAPHEA